MYKIRYTVSGMNTYGDTRQIFKENLPYSILLAAQSAGEEDDTSSLTKIWFNRTEAEELEIPGDPSGDALEREMYEEATNGYGLQYIGPGPFGVNMDLEYNFRIRHIYGESVVNVKMDDMHVHLNVLKGTDIRMSLSIQLVCRLLDAVCKSYWKKEVRYACQRRNDFRIIYRTGTSDATDYSIETVEDGVFKKHHILHESMYGKVHGFDVYLPDLLELAYSLGLCQLEYKRNTQGGSFISEYLPDSDPNPMFGTILDIFRCREYLEEDGWIRCSSEVNPPIDDPVMVDCHNRVYRGRILNYSSMYNIRVEKLFGYYTKTKDGICSPIQDTYTIGRDISPTFDYVKGRRYDIACLGEIEGETLNMRRDEEELIKALLPNLSDEDLRDTFGVKVTEDNKIENINKA